jgi:hypothetical protein
MHDLTLQITLLRTTIFISLFSPSEFFNPLAPLVQLIFQEEHLLPLQLFLSNRESNLKKSSLFLGVAGLQSSSDRGTWVTAGIHDVLTVMMFRVVEKSLDSRLSERPSTGVERFLLTPNNGLGVRILVEVFFELLPWEGVELFDTGDGNVFDALLGTVFVELGVDLSGTENDTIDFLWLLDSFTVSWVGDDPLELRVSCELFNWRTR